MYCSSASATAHNYGALAAMDRDSEIRLVVQTVFGKYSHPANHITMTFLVNDVTRKLIQSMSEYTVVAMEVERWIEAAIADGFLHCATPGGLMLMTDYQQLPLSPTMQKLSDNKTSEAINDFTCGTCGNNRTSKNEGTCWRCGGKL
jgi:hypothetical protein